jgi:hypothetical protein
MDDPTAALTEAFEDAEYEVGETSVNRDRVRVAVLDPEASAERLREITYSVVDAADVLGFDVTTESAEGQQVRSVVSFRYRN